MPATVATPLPPRNRRVIGAMWPITAAMPAATPSGRPPTARPSPAASAPLSRSPRRPGARPGGRRRGRRSTHPDCPSRSPSGRTPAGGPRSARWERSRPDRRRPRPHAHWCTVLSCRQVAARPIPEAPMSASPLRGEDKLCSGSLALRARSGTSSRHRKGRRTDMGPEPTEGSRVSLAVASDECQEAATEDERRCRPTSTGARTAATTSRSSSRSPTPRSPSARVCGGTLRKVFSPVGVVLKGSGFYRTDSRSSSGNGKRRQVEEVAERPSKARARRSSACSDSIRSSSTSSSGVRHRRAPTRGRPRRRAAPPPRPPDEPVRPRRCRRRRVRRLGLLRVPRRRHRGRGRHARSAPRPPPSPSAASATCGWRSSPATARRTTRRRTG